MDQYRVFGNPIAHSRSPWIHSRFAALTGQVMSYQRQLVPIGGWSDALSAFRAAGGRGCNVTVPFKLDAFASATQRSARAERARACNTLMLENDEVRADNTDGQGLVNDIVGNAGVALRGTRLLLIGAGGAAAGVLGPLIEAGIRELVICNRTPDKALGLVQRHLDLAQQLGCVLRTAPIADPGLAFDVVVNATSSSLGGSGSPVPARVLRSGSLAYDMMYGPAAGTFTTWAQAEGALARDGLGMLVEQAAEAFALWRGVRPPSDQVLSELRALMRAGQ